MLHLELFKYLPSGQLISLKGRKEGKLIAEPRKTKKTSKNPDGYWRRGRTVIDGKEYSRTRIVWEMHKGPIKKGMVLDHINRDEFDDRIENIRQVPYSVNNFNRDHISGRRYTGVERLPSGRYRAHISKDRKYYNLGTYDTEEQAYEVRKASEIKLYGELANK